MHKDCFAYDSGKRQPALAKCIERKHPNTKKSKRGCSRSLAAPLPMARHIVLPNTTDGTSAKEVSVKDMDFQTNCTVETGKHYLLFYEQK